MKQIALIASQEFEHDGRSLTRGEFFETVPIQAAMLTRSRKARFATPDEQAVARAPKPEPIEKAMSPRPARKPRTPRKPRTHRRDIAHAPVTK